MKKRILSLGLVLAMTATLFAGCGGNDDKGSGGASTSSTVEKWDEGDVTVSWWLMGGTDE